MQALLRACRWRWEDLRSELPALALARLPHDAAHLARPRAYPQDQPQLALEGRVPCLLAQAVRLASTRLTSRSHPASTTGGLPGAVGAGVHPGIPGTATRPTADSKPETGHRHNQ
jgi:hypothetical protein